jgi:hypothetical protein
MKTMVSRMPFDGLNSIKYDLIKVEEEHLFTRILVSYNETELVQKKYDGTD